MSALGRVTLLCLKRMRRSRDVVGQFKRWAGLLREVLAPPSGVAAFAAILRYVSLTTDTPPERLREFVQALGPKSEEALMTAAQEWMKEGEAKGRAEGEAKGRAPCRDCRFR